ncbi:MULTISPECIES: NAD(P)-dependent oxidoreductase [Stappiaceae]|uniref:dihydrouracil dehydrogenase (NAD(+)) n=2 Tax=Roseibium TaxID=150830 RepID=A0A0M6Y5T0_9HYPH|nr:MULTISPECIES: NAD(P)-dependent oxidoreductase [Stappiaceae]MEC9400902.1 NAD(P)-dependent oxidoreductase [Pseudomonadota bacterium]AMN56315.1 dihydropyrimidine dehydrogenase [Labrenzia sp. CP4]AQQ07309.1 dihydropyrimidine dehydrogenase [Roseibium aggregatum]MEC9470197.1 NAD(P)-dependent oxidoreductase [Pseudomonadota bacterium]NKX63844.1 NAD(P)-dependent oxidoreductase [Labrenzia sp. 5N]
MTQTKAGPDIAAGRLPEDAYAENFSDLHPLLDQHEAQVEADRCYFCYDAPCMQACPTSIDIPQFIRQISTGNPTGAAKTIFAQNILGGMCARVCPTETLCEQVCVREVAEGKPVKIGELQRYSTDHFMSEFSSTPFTRAAATGKKVAVVGAGPAGLSCAHRLAVHGHDVTLFDAREKAGGLNEYGIASYKSVDDFAAREVDFILSIGGIEVRTGMRLGTNLDLATLRAEYDAVFLGIGLGGVNALGLEGEDKSGSIDAVDYIADLRQSKDLSELPVGRRIVVIGGGMTAVDIAVQTKLLGAEDVTIAYRRGQDRMNASEYEQQLAQTSGVRIMTWAQPKGLVGENGAITAIELERTQEQNGSLTGTGEVITLPADMVFKAVGQTLVQADLGDALSLEKGRIVVDADRKTSLADVWAGGDCVLGGEDLTVAAVEDGKIAAESINAALTA